MIVDSQAPDGALPGLTPPGDGYPADPNWGTALPTITWQLYRHYGDVKILEAYYYPIRAYIEYLRGYHNKSGLINFLSWNADWVPPPPHNQTNLHLTGSFAFLHDVNTLLNMSEILGKTNDTQIYSVVYQQLTEEFHRVFFSNTSNFYSDGMQAAQVLALALPRVVPTNVRSAIIDHLVSNITENGNHVTTGIVSTARIYPVLSDNGHHDLALEMISSITYPSYGFMFTNPYENATAIWELWDAPFEGPSMNSRNHQMYASVGAWFYSHLAGLELSSDMITIRPRMASETKKHLMSKLDCQLSTLYGLVHISYTRDERDTIANSILLRVTIPSNARARVMFEPLFIGGQCQMLLEGNKVIWSSAIDSINYQEYHVEKDLKTGLMTVHIGSGQYEFQAVWK
jgi:alpha-L-rhamnosidase